MPTHLIKRYPNRKLYDTESNHYIHLKEIERLIDEGVAVQVIDVASGHDITAAVLVQVLLAVSRRSVAAVAVAPLLHMIRAAKVPGEVAEAIGQLAAPREGEARPAFPDGGDGALARAVEKVLQRCEIPRRSDLRRIENMLTTLNAQIDAMLADRETPGNAANEP